jgi:hypothetical protein
MLMLGAHEGAYASAALFVALGRKLIDKEVISKEEMSGIVDEAGALLSQGNSVSMRQALQLLPWLRKDLGIEDATKELGGDDGQEPDHDLRSEE